MSSLRTIAIPAGSLTLELPIADRRSAERAIGRIDVGWRLATPSGLSRGHGHRLLFDGLVERGARLPTSGKLVETKNDAIGWLFETIAVGWDANAKQAEANGDPVGPAGGK